MQFLLFSDSEIIKAVLLCVKIHWSYFHSFLFIPIACDDEDFNFKINMAISPDMFKEIFTPTAKTVSEVTTTVVDSNDCTVPESTLI